MKFLYAALVAAILCVSAHAASPVLAAQPASGHSASLTWTASPDGGTVNLYRAAAACATGITFTKIQSGLPAAGPASDTTISAGNWCYYVTAVVQGMESAPSNNVTLTVSPQPPSGLAGTAN